MFAKNLLSESIAIVKTSNTGLEALSIMEECKLEHLPIVNNVDYLGLLSESDIFAINQPEEAIGNYSLSKKRPYVYDFEHIYDVLRIMEQENISVVAVLDKKTEQYIGAITRNSILQALSNITALSQPGGIIVLEMPANSYQLSEIANIVESNDASILSCFVNAKESSNILEVTIKINKEDISAIAQTFNRYEYTIMASYAKEDSNWDELKDRWNLLMKYLNM
jgi:acetoin utilization protein AcuB